ncbi:g2015 [Coccomyxa viridis]|uniref:Mannosyl-oligosaccharide glucosidase n=1 Tax=Coccomyxa viridis TaxID=1274662 RepID=A0ABP1FLI8_9CHLO
MRHPQSLVAGMMWFDPDRQDVLSNIRHLALERDGLRKYGWEAHDGEQYGRQELFDERIQLTTSFRKRFCQGCTGGDWAVRLQAKEVAQSAHSKGAPDQEPQRISLLFYIGNEQVQNSIRIAPRLSGSTDHIIAEGRDSPVGSWALHMQGSKGVKLFHLGLNTPHFHNLTELVLDDLASGHEAVVMSSSRRRGGGPGKLQLSNSADPGSNLALFQVTRDLPLVVDFVFTGSLALEDTQSSPRIASWWDNLPLFGQPLHHCVPSLKQQVAKETPAQRFDALSGMALTRELEEGEAAFKKRFQQVFGNADDKGRLHQGASKAALSNMLGGIGYFFGASDVRKNGTDGVGQSWPAALFSAVPSRPFFPRGFIWDEGFHQLLIRQWDKRLSRDILAHWLDLLSEDGWIAREQILGEEARARVPADFLVQSPDVANPPTLFLPLADMAQRVAKAGSQIDEDGREELAFLKAAYPRLLTWFEWFKRTQAGPVPGSFRWRGREPAVDYDSELNKKTFASGLDDYPRSSHPSDMERHVDLLCWMALASRALATIASSIAIPKSEVGAIQETAQQLSDVRRLNELHYDRAAGQYRDWGEHTEAVSMQWVDWKTPEGHFVKRSLVRVVEKPEPSLQLVPHFGYVGLFPMLVRMLPADSSELGGLLKGMADPGQLWTQHGLRSLSKNSSIYNQYNTEHDAPYWRAPIWLNINFLALSALKHYSQVPGRNQEQARQLYAALRDSILSNVGRQYQLTGYLWENYKDDTGNGQGSHPFTGWTALLVLMESETYFDV